MIFKKLRFNEIQTSISGGSSKTLTKRLKTLLNMDIIVRKAYNEIPPRVEYSLTEKGKDLQSMFESLSRWISKWAHVKK